MQECTCLPGRPGFQIDLRVIPLQPHCNFIIPKAIVICCFAVFACLVSNAQINSLPIDYLRIEDLTIDNGLSQGLVSGITQDHYGYLWLTTLNGLNKYDGYKFTIYRHNADDSTSLAENYVSCVKEDSKGRLWVGTSSQGLELFDGDAETFIHFRHDPKNPNSVPNSRIDKILEDPSGAIWIYNTYSWNSVCRIKLNENENGKIKYAGKSYNVQIENGADILENKFKIKGSPQKIDFYSAKGNNIWLVQGEFAYILDKEVFETNKKVTSILLNPETIGDYTAYLNYSKIKNDSVYNQEKYLRLVFDTLNNKTYAVKSSGEILEISGLDFNCPVVRTLNKIPGKNEVFYAVADKEGAIWMFADKGTFRYNPVQYKIWLVKNTVFEENTDIQKYMSPNNFPYVDRSGIIWVSTGGYGAYKIFPESDKFNPNQNINNNRLSITSIYEDNKNQILVSSIGWQSPLLFDRNTKEYRSSFFSDKILQFLKNGKQYYGQIVQDKKGIYWLALENGYLAGYNKEKETIQIFDVKKYGTINGIGPFYFDGGNKIWFGNGTVYNFNALTCFNTDSQKVVGSYLIPGQAVKKTDAVYAFISEISEAKDGILWLGTMAGIYSFNTRSSTWKQFKNIPGKVNSLSSNMVFSLCKNPKEPEKYIWAGTNNAGLNKMNMQTGECTRFGLKDGLPDEVIYGILNDDSGNLWLSTNKGLSCFDPVHVKFKNYVKEDGLQGNEFNRNAYVKAKNGDLFFGGVNGMNFFRPGEIIGDKTQPQITFTDFKVLNNHVSYKEIGSPLRHPIATGDTIVLKWNQNILSFEFAALDFTNSARNLYKYMLEGFDKHWVDAGDRREATYTNLGPGEYTFKVLGSNSDGVWCTRPAIVKIIINPPWWLTWWAKMLYAMLGISGILLFIQIRTRNLKKRTLELEEKVKTRTLELEESNAVKDKLFSIVSHDLKSPLNAIDATIQLLQGENISPEQQKKFLGYLNSSVSNTLNMLNNLLTWSVSQIRGAKLHFSRVNLKETADEIIAIYKEPASQKSIKVISEIPEKTYVYADPDVVKLIFRNLLNNAIKFSYQNGEIVISKMENEKMTGFSVKDNGMGISREKLANTFDLDNGEKVQSGTASEKGTGIGLHLCHELILKSGGTIEVESAEGKGSEFRVMFKKENI